MYIFKQKRFQCAYFLFEDAIHKVWKRKSALASLLAYSTTLAYLLTSSYLYSGCVLYTPLHSVAWPLFHMWNPCGVAWKKHFCSSFIYIAHHHSPKTKWTLKHQHGMELSWLFFFFLLCLHLQNIILFNISLNWPLWSPNISSHFGFLFFCLDSRLRKVNKIG